MSIAAPELKVEVKFGAGPDWGLFSLGSAVIGVSGLGDPDATYTDISSYVRSVSINRGKSRELEEYRAGRAQIVLSNTSRIFDPTYTSSSLYPDVKPGRMCKITAIHPTTAVETILYKGIIRNWSFDYSPAGPNSGDATATILCSDILYDIGNANFTTTASSGKSGQQIIAVLDAINITDRSVDTGLHDMQSTSYSNSPSLSALRNIAYSEGVDVATIYASKTNQIVYEDAASLDLKSNQGTFGGSSLPITSVDLDYSSDLIRNSILYTRTGGSVQTQESSDSITDYGIRTLTRTDLVNATDSDVSSLASSALSQFKDAELRIRNIRMAPQENASLMTKVLGMELRDLITVEFSPPSTGTIEQDHFVIGIEMTFKPQTMTAKFTLNSTTGKVGENFIIGYATLGTSKLGF